MNDFKAGEKEEQKQDLEDKTDDDKETENTVMIQCKKTDGKRWHCKRLANPPHSLCCYHLAQLRSYRTRFEEDQILKKPNFDVNSNYYYYYSVLGPWWGKRRGPIESCNENSESETSARESRDEIVEEEDVFCEVKCNVKKKKKIMKRKRGRKPAKCRSLKSLL